MKINIPRMLLHLRKEITQGKKYPSERKASPFEGLAMKGWRLVLANAFMLELANRFGRLAQWAFVKGGRVTALPPPLSGWTKYRDFPRLSSAPFRARWRRYLRK